MISIVNLKLANWSIQFIPCGDLHHVLIDAEKSSKLNLKWRLKMSLDIANGMGYVSAHMYVQ